MPYNYSIQFWLEYQIIFRLFDVEETFHWLCVRKACCRINGELNSGFSVVESTTSDSMDTKEYKITNSQP